MWKSQGQKNARNWIHRSTFLKTSFSKWNKFFIRFRNVILELGISSRAAQSLQKYVQFYIILERNFAFFEFEIPYQTDTSTHSFHCIPYSKRPSLIRAFVSITSIIVLLHDAIIRTQARNNTKMHIQLKYNYISYIRM